MKKFYVLFALLLIPALFLASCEGKKAEKEFIPVKSFSLHMTATKDKKAFEADIICLNSEDITLDFTSPQELSGFSLKTEGDGYKVNVFGIEDEITAKEINSASLINVLIKAIKLSAFTNHGLFTEEDGIYSAYLTVDGIPVTVFFSEEGFLQKITSDSLNFSAQFEISG